MWIYSQNKRVKHWNYPEQGDPQSHLIPVSHKLKFKVIIVCAPLLQKIYMCSCCAKFRLLFLEEILRTLIEVKEGISRTKYNRLYITFTSLTTGYQIRSYSASEIHLKFISRHIEKIQNNQSLYHSVMKIYWGFWEDVFSINIFK